MDALAVGWLVRGFIFAIATGAWIGYMMGSPRHWMAPVGLFVSAYSMIIHFVSVLIRPTQPLALGIGVPTWLRELQNLNWGLIGGLLIIAAMHAMRIRKLRNGTYTKLASIVQDVSTGTDEEHDVA